MLIRRRNNSGQALAEFALILPIMLTFVFGIWDFSRAIYDREVTMNLAGEGSSLASRSTDTLAQDITAVITDTGSDISMSTHGCVIMTTVTSTTSSGKTTYPITQQATSSTCYGSPGSKIGNCTPVSGSCTGKATIPAGLQTLFTGNPSATVYITEVFYAFSPATPIGKFLHDSSVLPSEVYSVAFY